MTGDIMDERTEILLEDILEEIKVLNKKVVELEQTINELRWTLTYWVTGMRIAPTRSGVSLTYPAEWVSANWDEVGP